MPTKKMNAFLALFVSLIIFPNTPILADLSYLDKEQLKNDTIIQDTYVSENAADTLDPSDSLLRGIDFSPEDAANYLTKLIEDISLWREENHYFRLHLKRMLNQYTKPIDSIRTDLATFDFENLDVRLQEDVLFDTIPLFWLNDSTFIRTTQPLDREPFITSQTETEMEFASDTLGRLSKLLRTTLPVYQDSLMLYLITETDLPINDTPSTQIIDSLYLESKDIQLYRLTQNRVLPPFIDLSPDTEWKFAEDSTQAIIKKTQRIYTVQENSPFKRLTGETMIDSLKYAVNKVLDFTETRDSILIHFSHPNGQQTPFWLTTADDILKRLWVKNEADDSVTVWVGNPSKHIISFVLDDNLGLEQRDKFFADNQSIADIQAQRSLLPLDALDEIPVFWEYAFSNAFTINQTHFTNWNRGGESSLATNIEISAKADYHNEQSKVKWINNGRLRYGSIRTEEHGFRTNTDILEFNSQLNRPIIEKLDFSTVLYMKTQIAEGYNYPNDSVIVSKFLNPGTFTLGVGGEYKPFEETSLNLSPLSYRNTFITDTTIIDQTVHGIEQGKRVRHELGGQLVVRNSLDILDGLKINNTIRLFSNYIEKPQNVDIDWEINLEKQISWFFSIRLSFHGIYDDDIRFPLLDAEGEPILLEDGSEKRVAKLQFKQFLGLTLAFNL